MTAKKVPSPEIKVPGRGSPTKRTPGNEAVFLAALSETANVTKAMKVAGLSRAGLYYWLNDDPEFKARFLETVEMATDSLEDEAVRRAHEGLDKPVYQGGKLVGHVREYSDTLLIFLLKARRPEKYRERYEHTGPNGGPIQITVTSEDAGVL